MVDENRVIVITGILLRILFLNTRLFQIKHCLSRQSMKFQNPKPQISNSISVIHANEAAGEATNKCAYNNRQLNGSWSRCTITWVRSKVMSVQKYSGDSWAHQGDQGEDQQ